METTEQAVEAHNAADLVNAIRTRLDVIEHERWQIEGMLDDLCVYLPKEAVGSDDRTDYTDAERNAGELSLS